MLRSLISARKKLVGQRVTLENQIRVLRSCSGSALAAAFIDNALRASEGIAGLSAAMRGLIAARTAVMTAVAAIDADMRRMTRASAACRRLMTIPGVGQLTALAFVAAIDDPSRIRRSPRDIGAYLGLVPRRYQSGEVDYTGGISKCGDRRVRTLLYEAANVMLTRYKGQQTQGLGLRDRQTINDAQSAGCSGSPTRDHYARDAAGRDRVRHRHKPAPRDRRPKPSSHRGATPEGGSGRWRRLCSCGSSMPTAISTKPHRTQLTPSSAERARRRRHPKASIPKEPPALTH